MKINAFRMPEKMFLIQRPMLRVSYALSPLALFSIYLFGWRSLALIGTVFLFGIMTEGLFTYRQGAPVTSAVFVTCLIFALSLPPTIPFWMAVVGIVFGVAIGKMAFGGFGRNVFNPAMVGRCFIYITFPIQLTNDWIKPMGGGMAGFSVWSPIVDGVTTATPMTVLRQGASFSFQELFFGKTAGCLGETSAFLILLGGIYIIYKKAAPWRLAVSCLFGGILASAVLHGTGIETMPAPLSSLLSGSFLFGTAFVVTEPISGAKTKPGQWIYGFFVGALTMVLRGFSNFSEGMMFSVLLMNAFVPLLDHHIGRLKKAKEHEVGG